MLRATRTFALVGALLACGLLAIAGCSSTTDVPGDAGGGDDGSIVSDSGADALVSPPPPPPKDGGGGDSATTDSGGDGAAPVGDAGVDAAIPLGPPGKPGLTLSAGGVVSSSAHYKVVAALGESPGGTLTSKSSSYRLQGGVIGATQ